MNAIPIPTTIVTGFLGAGKTTIISHLIDHLQNKGEQVAYVKNEIGDATIDNTIMQGKHIQTKELLNGCICCTLTGPFLFAIDELIEKVNPDRVIIEASGTADASALALLISSHPKLFRDGVVTVIDVVNFDGFEDLSITAQNQTKFTDLIIFNKIELVDLDRKRAVVGYVRELNTHSPIIEAPNGKVEPEVIFGIGTSELSELLKQAKTEDENHQHSETHTHLEQDHIQSFVVEMKNSQNLSKLKDVLEKLPASIFRVKGFVRDESEKIHLVQKVGQRVEIQPFETDQPSIPTQLIFIGFEIRDLEESVASLLETSS